MSVAWTIAGGGLLPHALGGAALLLFCWALMRAVSHPGRRQRVGLWGMAAALVAVALSFAPPWLCVPLTAPPAPVPPPAPTPETPDIAEALPPAEVVALMEEGDLFEPVPATPPAREVVVPAAPPAEGATGPSLPLERLLTGLGQAHALVAGLLLLRWLAGHVGLWRLLRSAEPAPPAVAAVCAALAGPRRLPRLLQSPRLRVPVSCGLLRPTILLPTALCREPGRPELRWALAHELTHLERRDPWASLLFALGAALFFPLPWFWWLRRQVRLCQEYVADAAAAGPGEIEDYAEFLLRLTRAPAVPTGALSVVGHTSDLLRRITMLLHRKASAEGRAGRLWSVGVASGLLALAVVVAGVGRRAEATPLVMDDPVKQDERKKDEGKQDERKRDGDRKDAERKRDADRKDAERKRDGDRKDAERKDGDRRDPERRDGERRRARSMEELFRDLERIQGLDEEQMKKIREKVEAAMKRLEGIEGFGPPPGFLPGRVPEGLGGAFGVARAAGQGRLGVQVEKPSDSLADQLELPRGQGVVVTEVVPNSAAAKAGLKVNDVLLEIGGKKVPNDAAGLARLVADLKGGEAIEAVVLRKGKKETVKGITLPELRRATGGGRVGPGPGGALGGGGGFGGFGGFGGGEGFPGFFGGDGIMTSVMRNNDRFQASHREGNLMISVSGAIEEGKPKVKEIAIREAGRNERYDSLDKVPEAQRDKVKNLVEMVEKQGVKVKSGTR